MNENKFWIVRFQHLPKRWEGSVKDNIRCRSTCVDGETILKALENAKARIELYLDNAGAGDRFVITSASIAYTCDRENIYAIWKDIFTDPNPELFEDVSPEQKVVVRYRPRIIRCKDCKHRFFNEHYGEKGYLQIKATCELDTGDIYALGRNADIDEWYCADAEAEENVLRKQEE